MFDVHYIAIYAFSAGNGYVVGTYTTTRKGLQYGNNLIGNFIVLHTYGKKSFQKYFTTRPNDKTGEFIFKILLKGQGDWSTRAIWKPSSSFRKTFYCPTSPFTYPPRHRRRAIRSAGDTDWTQCRKILIPVDDRRRWTVRRLLLGFKTGSEILLSTMTG